MKRFRTNWGKPSKGVVQLMLAAVMVVALLATAVPGVGAAAEDDTGSITKDQGAADVDVLDSDSSGTIIDIHVQGVQEEEIEVNNETFQVLTISGYAYTSEVGKPQMPVIRETIGIPDGASVRATTLDASYSTYTGYKVYPVQPPEVDLEQDGEFAIDEEFYSQDAFYPEEIVEVGTPAIWRDVSVVGLQVNPVLFNPASGEVRVYDHITVELEYSGGEAVSKTIEPKFARMYGSVILNYDFLDIVEQFLGSEDIAETGGPLPSEDGFELDGTPVDTSIKLLSIRPRTTIPWPDVKPFLDWHKKRGLPYVSYGLFEPMTANDVKSLINSVYTSHPELEYVLLVGDINLIPWQSSWGGEPGDYWYACLTGGASPDLYPEVAVGRLTVNNVTELQQQTTKIITYSDSPPAGAWVNRVLLIAHKQDAPGKYQGCKEDIRTAAYSDPFTFDTAYGAAAAQGGDDATNADVKSAIDAGRGIVNYRGHGSPGDPSPRPWGVYWGRNWNTSNEEFWTTNAHALANGDMTPVVFSISCLNAALDNAAECLGEAFVKDDDSAVAFLGAARPSYTTPNHEFDKDLFDAIGNEGIYNIGLVLNDANVELINRYGATSSYTDNCRMYLWLGDPALELWTTAPRLLSATYPSTVSTSITVTVKHGALPLANALVCLTKGDPVAPDIYTYKYTNASGQATFSFSPSYDGPMNVSVTKHNYWPHKGTTTVDTTAPSVTVTSPNGGEVWSIGSAHNITWTATDSLDVVTTIDIYYSVDGGSTYPYTVATGEANDGTYPWTIPNTASTKCRVKVVAHDDAGYSSEDVSDANFTISKPNMWVTPPSFDVTLPPNTTWNGNLRIGNQGLETLTYSITDTETTGGPCFKWVAQDPDPLPAYYSGILKAEVHDPDGLADIDYVKLWVIQRPSDWGYMYDDGTHGDEIAGDGVYTSGISGTTLYGEEVGVLLQAEDLAGNVGRISYTVNIDIGDASAAEGTKGLLSPGAETRYTGTVEPSEGAQVQGNTSEERTETVEVTPSYDVDALAAVALFKDSNPWGYTAIEDLLIAHGIPYDIYNSSDMGTVDLSGYDKVITASVQGDTFWDALEANKAWFESYVNAGGILEVHLAAYTGSNSPGKVYPGGFVYSHEGLQYVSILDPTHPVVNIPNVVTDAELDEWNSSTHGWFSAIPPGGNVILTATANGEPVWAEAEFGSGYIFATAQTVEWRAGHGYPEFLENMILHMPMPDCPWLDEDPKFGLVAPGEYDDIAVTIDTTGLAVGEYSAEIYIANNDPNKNPTIVPVQLRVKAAIDVGNVLFDETHSPSGGGPGYFTIEDIYADWAELLTSWGFTVESETVGPITYDLLKNYCAVVLPEPTERYSTAEVDAIKQYVNDGGGLLILGEFGGFAQQQGIFPVVNQLAAPFDMSFNNDIVRDDAHNDENNFWPLIPDFDTAVVGADVDQVVEYAGCSIGTEGYAFPIAWTYGGAYTDMAALADLLLDGSGAGIAEDEVSAPAPEKSAQTRNYAGEGIDATTGEVAGGSVGVRLTPMADTDAGGKVLWDLTHGVYLAYEPSGYFSSLVAMLTEKGYTIETTAAGILTVDLNEYAVLVVCLGSAWDSAYTTAEVTAIINFVEGGGGLLVMGDNTICPNGNINPVSQEFGTTCGISDANTLITNLAVHPIFDGVSTFYMGTLAGEIDGSISPSEEVAWDDAGKAVVSVATGSGRVVITGDINQWDNSYISEYDNQLFAENTFDWLSTPPEPVPVMAASLYGDGRTMVIGDGGLFCNGDPDGDGFMSLYEYDNEKLAVNIIDWLCQPVVEKKPDLVISRKWEKPNPESPLEYVVTYTVRNLGTETAKGGHSSTLYVDKNLIEHKVVPVDLKPGESFTDTFKTVLKCTPPEDIIVVCADDYNEIAELNENNNCLKNIWSCCVPSIEVVKEVWDRCTKEWVEETCAPLKGVVKFRCVIHNDGTCCDLTKILVRDILSESLVYIKESATVNGRPWEPREVGPNTYEWDFAGWVLRPSQRITIEFDAGVVKWSPRPDINLQEARAWCEKMEIEVSDEDEAAVQPFIPGDANMDGAVDVFDLVKVKRIILGLEDPTCGADANQDCAIDVFDLVKIKRIILGLDS